LWLAIHRAILWSPVVWGAGDALRHNCLSGCCCRRVYVDRSRSKSTVSKAVSRHFSGSDAPPGWRRRKKIGGAETHGCGRGMRCALAFGFVAVFGFVGRDLPSLPSVFSNWPIWPVDSSSVRTEAIGMSAT
jgi:hypothetical protein